jgi:integrase
MLNPLLALNSPHSRARYAAVWREYDRELTAEGVQAYIAEWREAGAAPATVNLKLAAMKCRARAEAPAEEVARIEAIKGMPMHGVRMGSWLSLDQVNQLLAVPGNGLAVDRNRAILAMLVGTALRRAELVSLKTDHLQTLNGRLCIVDMEGKGRRVRTVPLPGWCAGHLATWLEAAGIATGLVWRRVYKGAAAEEGLSADHIHAIVKAAGVRIGVPRLAPHDLRRTWSQLAKRGGADIEQISITLGHANIVTTTKYLGGKLDLDNPAGDYIKL